MITEMSSSRTLADSLLGGGELHLGGSTLVSEELRVHSLERCVPLSLGLVDSVLMGLLVLVVSGMVLRLCHLAP